jgi:predicted dehydrogenase
VKGVVSRKNVRPTFEDGWQNQRVLDAVARSARFRRWIKL